MYPGHPWCHRNPDSAKNSAGPLEFTLLASNLRGLRSSRKGTQVHEPITLLGPPLASGLTKVTRQSCRILHSLLQSQRATFCSHLLTWVSTWETQHDGLTPGHTGGEATPLEELGGCSEQAGSCPRERTSQPRGPSRHPWSQLRGERQTCYPGCPQRGLRKWPSAWWRGEHRS